MTIYGDLYDAGGKATEPGEALNNRHGAFQDSPCFRTPRRVEESVCLAVGKHSHMRERLTFFAPHLLIQNGISCLFLNIMLCIFGNNIVLEHLGLIRNLNTCPPCYSAMVEAFPILILFSSFQYNVFME